MNGSKDKGTRVFLDWLDAAFLAESLGVAADQVLDVTAESAVELGSNYCSQLLRVRANVGGEKKYLIVKIMPNGDFLQGWLSAMGFFRKELKMYQSTLPAMRELGARRCGPDSVLGRPFTARGLPCNRPDTLVMEDLTAKGFRMQERRKQLDLTHCKVTLEALARFHALSVALHNEDPKYMNEYEDTLFRRQPRSKPYMSRPFNTLAAEMDTWEEVRGKGYSDRLRAIAGDAYLKLADCTDVRTDGRLNVLNHGDFWVNNVMFRYDKDDEEPVEVFLVDLQLCRFGSPALDLQYFINSSPREEVRLRHADELLEHYRQALNGHLTSLGLADRAVSADSLRRDYEEASFFGLYAAAYLLCTVLAEPENRLQLENLKDVSAPSPTFKAVGGKTYRKLVPAVLDHFIDRGVL